ncbi:MAG TPA: tetratricopeptide repeat protein [Xanthomonadales bacterium]
MSVFTELKRRNVFKVAAAYIIVGWLIMQAGDTLAPALRLPDWVNSLLAFFLLLGFPLAMFFAWAFELTPEGLRKEKDVDRTQSLTHVTGQKLNYTIIALLVAALGYFAYDKYLYQPRNTAATEVALEETAGDQGKPVHSIAVLPFVDMSAHGDNEYFSDGLTEELLNILANINELNVAGRTSSFAFKGKDEDLRSIGEKLNVVSILEGSVRKDDQRNRVRITAQLINVEDGYHLWSETYDRNLDDIFAIQDGIAHKVAQALRIELLGEDEARLGQMASTEIDAYDLYLKALQGVNEGGYVSLDRAVSGFQQVLALDPSYLPARIGLVNAWTQMAATGAITGQQAIQRGMPMLEQVLAEQPDNSAAHIQMAVLKVFEGDNETAEKEFITALELDPRNALGLNDYGRFLFDNGRIEHGLELINQALEMEPYAERVLWDQCQTNAYLQRLEISLAACTRIQEIAPESPIGYYGWALAHLHSGDIARTVEGFAKAIERDPGDYEMFAGMTRFWIWLGDADRAEQWQTRSESIGAGQPMPIWGRLVLLKYQEQHDLARELAQKALAQNADDRHGSQFTFRQTLAFELVRDGDYQAALALFRESFPWAFETQLVLPGSPESLTGDMIQIAALLKLADPTSERPEQLLTVVESFSDKLPPEWGVWASDLNRAAIATIRGDSDTAIQWLNSAWDKRWRTSWRSILLDNVVFSQLKNEPGYKDLVARFEADMDRQRQLAYELLEIGK